MIEVMLLSEVEACNLAVVCWIDAHARNQVIEKSSKIMLLLKQFFTHQLSTESGDNILKSCKSMTIRSTPLGRGGLDVSFHSNSSVAAKDYVETHYFFNQLIFHAFDNLLPEELNNCGLFQDNINFNVDSKGYALS